MSKPYLVRKIADDIKNIEDVWWREGKNGRLQMNRKIEELNQYFSGKYEITYTVYSDFNNRQHEYYLDIQESGMC